MIYYYCVNYKQDDLTLEEFIQEDNRAIEENKYDSV